MVEQASHPVTIDSGLQTQEVRAVSSAPLSPAEFEAEFHRRRLVLAESAADRDYIRLLAERVDDPRAMDAADHIVAAVRAGKRPSEDLVTICIRGGAVFWRPEHIPLGSGWPLHAWLGEFRQSGRTLEHDHAVNALREYWEDIRPLEELYGAIPVRASDGGEITLISVSGFGSTDMPLAFVRSPSVFMRMVRITGTLWADDFANRDPMMASDDVLAMHLRRAMRFAGR